MFRLYIFLVCQLYPCLSGLYADCTLVRLGFLYFMCADCTLCVSALCRLYPRVSRLYKFHVCQLYPCASQLYADCTLMNLGFIYFRCADCALMRLGFMPIVPSCVSALFICFMCADCTLVHLGFMPIVPCASWPYIFHVCWLYPCVSGFMLIVPLCVLAVYISCAASATITSQVNIFTSVILF